MARLDLSEKLAALGAGERWWPAEVVLRAIGLLLLGGFGALALSIHRMVATPATHSASCSELALCTAAVILLCGGLTLTFAGPVLFRRVPLPPHFTRYRETKP